MSNRNKQALAFASRFGESMGGLLVILVLLCCVGLISPGAHLQHVGLLHWQPEAGYRWTKDGPIASLYRVTWTPGSAHPQHPHVSAGSVEGRWLPASGYAWDDPSDDSLNVHWNPGSPLPRVAHVLADAREGFWRPEAGYRWKDRDANGATVDIAKGVEWEPGQWHPERAHVLASATEGQWKTESGYAFSNQDPNDLTVVSVLQDDGVPTWLKILGHIAVAAIAGQVAEPTADDGAFGRFVIEPVAREVRDKAIRDAAQLAFQ